VNSEKLKVKGYFRDLDSPNSILEIVFSSSINSERTLKELLGPLLFKFYSTYCKSFHLLHYCPDYDYSDRVVFPYGTGIMPRKVFYDSVSFCVTVTS
jgi:hypothetical protein